MIYSKITRKEYDALEGINFSKLKHFKESIKKGAFELTDKISTTALAMGSAVHILALEPQNFESQFIVGGPINEKTGQTYGRNTKAFESWLEENNRSIDQVLSQEDYEQACEISERARNTQTIKDSNLFEFAMTWTNKKTGMRCKCLVDFAKWGNYIGDLKTTELSLSPANLSKEVFNRQYHEQASFYLDGAEANGLINNGKFMFVFVQKGAERDVLEKELGWESIELGNTENLKCLENYKKYTQGIMNGYTYEQYLDVPNWALNAHFNKEVFEV